MENIKKTWKTLKNLGNHQNILKITKINWKRSSLDFVASNVRWACGGRAGACGGRAVGVQGRAVGMGLKPRFHQKSSKKQKTQKTLENYDFPLKTTKIYVFSLFFAFSCGINQTSWFSLILKGIFICYMILLGKWKTFTILLEMLTWVRFFWKS